MAKTNLGIELRRLNINIPIELDNRIDYYRKYYGINKTNAIINLINNSLELFERVRLEEEYDKYRKEKCNYNILI